VSGEVGLVRGQDRTQKSQVLKLAEFFERRWLILVNRKRERRPVMKQPEEDQVVLVYKGIDPVAQAIHDPCAVRRCDRRTHPQKHCDPAPELPGGY
jgi:hypothetical protein